MADTKDEPKVEEVIPEPVVEAEVGEVEFVPPHQWDEQERIKKERYAIDGYAYDPLPYPFEAPVVEE